MSIFKATFSPTVKNQLTVRQKAMTNRTPKNLQYLNSRNAWIRMSSSVDIVQIGPEGNEEGNKDLAKKYILHGGILYNNRLRSGIGDFTKAYSNTASDGTPYRLGIRPMPGITNIEVKSKSAYGSLREAVVSFQCWDIKQLEDLELLYMRPGYTVLLEWGWSPYLNNKGEYNTNVEFYDIIDTLKPKEKEEIWKELYAKTTETGEYLDTKGEKKTISHYDGNYDAMFGFVKNYSWSARPDGGYDCQTTIISMGEIVESLKVNYTPTNIDIRQSGGILRTNVVNTNEYDAVFAGDKLGPYYQKNILAGLWAEVYGLIFNNTLQFVLDSPLNGKTFRQEFKSTANSANTSNTNNKIDKGGIQCYITLEAFVDLINQNIIPVDTISNRPLMTLSLKDRDGNDLQCVAHPMQVSVDINTCLINSPLWSGGTVIESIQEAAQDPTLAPKLQLANSISTAILRAAKINGTDEQGIVNAIRQINNIEILQIVNQNIINDKTYKDLENLLNTEFNFAFSSDIQYVTEIKNHLKNFNVIVTLFPKVTITYNDQPIQPTTVISQFQSLSKDAPQVLANIDYLKKLNQFYFIENNNPYPELGLIKNIYVNVNFLYQLSLDLGLEVQDKKEKSEINLYDYVKRVMSTIQAALGNVSTFDLHVDPIDNNVARIIDVNYTGGKGKSIYDSLFELQVQNLNSVVRNYSLQSQIFPEQSTIIAIGSQAEGGQLGVQNNTMIDFNRKIRDRILPEKIAPIRSLSNKKDGSELIGPLYSVVQYFSSLNTAVDPNASNAGTGYTEVKNSLRDLIVYFQTITASPGKNRSLIPIKFSFEMDGIGGLVIGHMFRLPKDVLPKGYKGEGVGTELGQVVTSISHTLNNNDWTTKIDALNIVLVDNNGTLKSFIELNLSELLKQAAADATSQPIIPSTGRIGGATQEFYGQIRKNGEIEDLLVSIRPDLLARHNSSVNQSDGGRIRLQSAPMKNLEALLTDAYNAGVYLRVNSAYRDYNDQVRIKQDSLKGGSPAAQPGTSNHGFGLAVDLANRDGKKINPITTKKEWAWVQANKAKYGFENINATNESHHYNYIGSLSATPPTTTTPQATAAPLPFNLLNYPTSSVSPTLPRLFNNG